LRSDETHKPEELVVFRRAGLVGTTSAGFNQIILNGPIPWTWRTVSPLHNAKCRMFFGMKMKSKAVVKRPRLLDGLISFLHDVSWRLITNSPAPLIVLARLDPGRSAVSLPKERTGVRPTIRRRFYVISCNSLFSSRSAWFALLLGPELCVLQRSA